MDDIVVIIQTLIDMPEVQALCSALYVTCLLLMLGLFGIFIAHTAFVLIGSRVMYRKKVPNDGWSKHFYPALFVLLVLVAATTWVFHQLSQGVNPFMV